MQYNFSHISFFWKYFLGKVPIYLGSAGGKGDNRGWDGWLASLTGWTWDWIDSGSWWWTGRPGVLWFMGLQRVRHDWATELNWTEVFIAAHELSLAVEVGATLPGGAWVSHGSGFSSSAWALGMWAQQSWLPGSRAWAQKLRHMGSAAPPPPACGILVPWTGIERVPPALSDS